jgi:1-acyl-sn-glycerol-3-phosphate acyltransferase
MFMAMSLFKKMRYYLIKCSQLVIIAVCKVIFTPTTKRTLMPVHPAKQSYLFAANHRRAFDPFVICALLPWRDIVKTLPLGFMSHNVFYDSPLRPFMWLAGCFPAKNPHGKHKIFGVDGAAKLLSEGFSIFVFPEGTRVYNRPRGDARPGIIRIHKASKQTPFILCHIEYHKDLRAWLTGNRRTVKYRVIDKPNYDNPEKVMDDVYAL